jgi:hypothetical protein
MCSTVVLIALSGTMASSVLATEPNWQKEYGIAREVGVKVAKPLAVFIGSGQTGWDQVSRDGQLGKEVRQLLAQQYVCLYVDAQTADGRKLAAAFEVTSGPGLVISNRSGNLQAFRHEGNLGQEDLKKHLGRYAEPDRVTTQTDTHAPIRMSYYALAPVQYAAPIYSPASFGGFSGRSC